MQEAHIPWVPVPTTDVKPLKYLGRYNCKLQIGALPVQGFQVFFFLLEAARLCKEGVEAVVCTRTAQLAVKVKPVSQLFSFADVDT